MRVEPTVPGQALAAIRAPILAAGAESVDAPILQPLGLLLDLAGEQMRARLFVVQSEGGAESCLRPDFTVAIARQHLERGAAAGRYAYEGVAFRAAIGETTPEEFLQIGLERFEVTQADIVGSDAETVALAWRCAVAGGRSDLTLWLGDVGLFAAFIDGMNLPEALAGRLKRAAGRPRLMQAELARAGSDAAPAPGGQLTGMLSQLAPAQAAELLEEVWSLAGIEPVGGRGPAEIAQRLVRRAQAAEAPSLTPAQADSIRRFLAVSEEPASAFALARAAAEPAGASFRQAMEAWESRLRALEALGVPTDRLRFATALGHAFDYYDGLTFEIRSEALGADRALAVGGRYDGLMARLGDAGQTRAIGCMVRPWRAFAGGEA
ncbi:ATP phosphoribosyltransferase regulatory subunit [Phenylobacterium sp.]|uniref:ATP phosphoribosyltransferase regulatory subunit n=1 Tax=Phenylobacterium sp. TaxID=1871053 RepID=UPI0027371220|nr:ATP phosphoribosyltransferase regulatory subunit [Phenylobacterium sp.]MDP3659444.1 ATP phosphoribosyltransferase regulatory subunit [Phenylobacterium sp.]